MSKQCKVVCKTKKKSRKSFRKRSTSKRSISRRKRSRSGRKRSGRKRSGRRKSGRRKSRSNIGTEIEKYLKQFKKLVVINQNIFYIIKNPRKASKKNLLKILGWILVILSIIYFLNDKFKIGNNELVKKFKTKIEEFMKKVDIISFITNPKSIASSASAFIASYYKDLYKMVTEFITKFIKSANLKIGNIDLSNMIFMMMQRYVPKNWDWERKSEDEDEDEEKMPNLIPEITKISNRRLSELVTLNKNNTFEFIKDNHNKFKNVTMDPKKLEWKFDVKVFNPIFGENQKFKVLTTDGDDKQIMWGNESITLNNDQYINYGKYYINFGIGIGGIMSNIKVYEKKNQPQLIAKL